MTIEDIRSRTDVMRDQEAALRLRKLQGCGNSFVVGLLRDFPDCARHDEAARRLCNRNFGPGSDGLILVSGAMPDFKLEMFNPDGSRMRMCGNGSRCACRYLVLEGMAPPDAKSLSLEICGRRIECFLSCNGRQVKVNMGKPSFEPATIGLRHDGEFISGEICASGEEKFRATALSIGNPHCVIFCDSVKAIPIEKVGPALCGNPLFEDGANIGFAQVVSPNEIDLIVWERGAGLTLACGSGACAAVVAGVTTGRLSEHVLVRLPGGELEVQWSQVDGDIFLNGPAQEVCEIVVPIEFILRDCPV